MLDHAIKEFGELARAGRREDGCAHVCFSRAGLLRGCSHYLTHGAEIDGHVVDRVFGDASALPLLRMARKPLLVTFQASFPEAAAAANPFGFPQDGSLPPLLGLLLKAWAWKVCRPGFEVASMRDCTTARVPGCVPAHRIDAMIEVHDADVHMDQP